MSNRMRAPLSLLGIRNLGIPRFRSITFPGLFLFLLSMALMAQNNTGELRLRVTDQSGAPLQATAELVSQASTAESSRPSAILL